MIDHVFTTLKLALVVFAVLQFFKTSLGKSIGAFFPTPFWIYLLPMLMTLIGVLPSQSPVYSWITKHILPAAILLMLVGAPVKELAQLGAKAILAMLIAALTIWLSAVIGGLLFLPYLPEGSWQAIGALLGTWIGGSANMIAVKEILGMADDRLAPIIVVDTILSYAWLALLLLSVKYQALFDNRFLAIARSHDVDTGTGYLINRDVVPGELDGKLISAGKIRGPKYLAVFVGAFAVGYLLIILGQFINRLLSFLAPQAWTLLAASLFGVFLALTPLQKVERWAGASQLGSVLLYFVLVTIGARTNLEGLLKAPIFMAYGTVVLILHAVLSLILARIVKIPLFLLATASQANIGGAISAPIVAEAYKLGTAPIGVLMAILGAIFGTYFGVLGAYSVHTLMMAVR